MPIALLLKNARFFRVSGEFSWMQVSGISNIVMPHVQVPERSFGAMPKRDIFSHSVVLEIANRSAAFAI